MNIKNFLFLNLIFVHLFISDSIKETQQESCVTSNMDMNNMGDLESGTSVKDFSAHRARFPKAKISKSLAIWQFGFSYFNGNEYVNKFCAISAEFKRYLGENHE